MFILAEPVHVINPGELCRPCLLPDFQPVCKIITHVVSAKGKHGHGVATQLPDLACCSRGGFTAGRCAEKGSVLPVERFRHKRNNAGAASTEKNRINRNPFRVLPLGRNYGALTRWRGKTRVGMSRPAARFGRPRTAQPVHQLWRLLVGHCFPPHVPFRSYRAVSEDRVPHGRQHGVCVRLHARARRHSEKTVFGVDRVETSVVAELHPCDVISYGFHSPSCNGRDQHRQVGFAASRREGAGHVFHFAGGVRELQDEHVLRHPAFIPRLHGGNAERMAFFPQQCVTAIA